MKKVFLKRILPVAIVVLGHNLSALAEEQFFSGDREKNKYCFQDTRFNAQVLGRETKRQQRVKIGSIDCVVQHVKDFDLRPHTNVTVFVKLASGIGTRLPLRSSLSAIYRREGHLTRGEACQDARSFKEYVAKNGYIVPASVKNEAVIKNEWISTQDGKPVQQIFTERVVISFGDRLDVVGEARKEVTHPYCSDVLMFPPERR